ncbi:hypothetical protein [Bacillus sp. Marseille-P3661]|uniref:hypothetical protein n=1 Tax=Bacillus sp. Marseille-P3661 TaxID=1936234 RepID=UPI000C866D72|nr:hypothetical protein [Bacillus sp. Marseille-P3661]
MADKDTVEYLMDLKRYKDVLPKQTMKTLKGQALSGDLEGAQKGLCTVLRRRAGRCERAQ